MELEPRTAAPAHATGAVEFVPLSSIADDATFRLRAEGDVAALAASIGRLGHLVPVELRPLPGAPEGPPRYQVVAGFRRLAALRLLARERVLARVHAALDDDDAWGIALAHALLVEPLVGSDLEALRTRLRTERLAPWAEELVDEALVRAPVDPDVRERFLDFLTAPPEARTAVAARVEDEGTASEEEGTAEDEDIPAAVTAAGGAASEDEAAGEGASVVPEARPVEGEEPAPQQAAEAEAGEGREIEVTAEELAADLVQRLSALNQDLALAFDAWTELPEEGRRMIVEQARYVAELFPHLWEER